MHWPLRLRRDFLSESLSASQQAPCHHPFACHFRNLCLLRLPACVLIKACIKHGLNFSPVSDSVLWVQTHSVLDIPKTYSNKPMWCDERNFSWEPSDVLHLNAVHYQREFSIKSQPLWNAVPLLVQLVNYTINIKNTKYIIDSEPHGFNDHSWCISCCRCSTVADTLEGNYIALWW